jgi:hypothetical protein
MFTVSKLRTTRALAPQRTTQNMLRVVLAFLAAVNLGNASTCQARTSFGPGIPRLGIWAKGIESGRLGDTLLVFFSMSGDYSPHTVGEGVVRLGRGLDWVHGDSIHTGRVSSEDVRWYAAVLATEEGRTEIRARMTVHESRESVTDEMEIVLPVEVSRDSVVFGMARTVRAETVRAGQRYRLAGYIGLVPIEGPEEVTGPDIKERPQVLRKNSVVCWACPRDSTWNLPFVVMIDRDGRPRSAALLEGEVRTLGATPGMVQSAQNALTGWRFAPARTLAGPVADGMYVTVEMNCHRRSGP